LKSLAPEPNMSVRRCTLSRPITLFR
jgi:hypothetical protein